MNSQRQRDKQRLIDLERNFNEEKQQKQRLELQMKTEKTLTKKLQDDLTKFSLAPARFVTNIAHSRILIHSRCFDRSECTEQCLKRKRDQENESREMRKLLNDKDERIKAIDNEIKVNASTEPSASILTRVTSANTQE